MTLYNGTVVELSSRKIEKIFCGKKSGNSVKVRYTVPCMVTTYKLYFALILLIKTHFLHITEKYQTLKHARKM